MKLFNIKHCLLMISLLITSAYAGVLEEYTGTIRSKCPAVKSLVIKKSLLEMTNGKNCNEIFTALLLSECPQLTCSTIKDIWTSSNSANSGAVIGK